MAANASIYFCQDTASNKIDRFGASYENNGRPSFNTQHWIVDTEKGWRRSDISDYTGSCEIENGYTVCKTGTNYGEATFSIHPDDSNFILIYLDYGIDALIFIGKCTKN
ncbi:MAG: hypothetical protein CMQ41_01460 [Gammaproteobacteria bacterium]|nr:hypothetical protein [Gammaproteobacteria bacterium]